MPTSAQIATVYRGIEPPANPNSATLWMSQSARHVQPPHSAYARTPIIGSNVVGTGAQSATQECSPWYNATLSRYECLVNISASQYFSYAATPAGPWSSPIKVLGSGSGGEASNSQQCSVLVESGTLFAYYYTSTSATILKMASAPMPTVVGVNPVFTLLGTIYDNNTAALSDSSWIVKANGLYYLFFPNNIQPAIAISTATDPTQFVATPFKKAANRITGLNFNTGLRYLALFGRPQVFYENGQWTLFAHTGGTDSWSCNVFRWTCTDVGIPVNWTPDPVRYMEQQHPLEVDQVADFRMLRGANDKIYMFWSGCDNKATKFTIMSAPATEPILAYDGADWTYVSGYSPNPQTGPQYINPDAITGAQAIKNMWDCLVRTNSADIPLTLPAAAGHVRVKVTNAPSTLTSTFLTGIVPVNATDIIAGGNPITAISAATTTVTVTTKRPHNLAVNDKVTVTGNQPNSYDTGAGLATIVTGVPTANSFTYTAATSPVANTQIGFYESFLSPGESRAYRVRQQGIFVRD